jgi:hypothetical protein
LVIHPTERVWLGVSRGEHHLVRKVLGIMPLLGCHQLRRFDGECVKESGLAIADVRARILKKLIDRLNVVRAECCEKGSIRGKHLILPSFIHDHFRPKESLLYGERDRSPRHRPD